MLNVEPNQTNKQADTKKSAQYLSTKAIIFHRTVREDRAMC